jgi:hypothetical protein
MAGTVIKGYRAVFYDNGEQINIGPIRNTPEEAQKDIDAEIELYSVFAYNPWTDAKIEEA